MFINFAFFLGKTTPYVFRRAAYIFRISLRSFAQYYFNENVNFQSLAHQTVRLCTLCFSLGKTHPTFSEGQLTFSETHCGALPSGILLKPALLDEPVLNIIVGPNHISKHDILHHLYTVRESEKATRGVP